MTDTPLNPHEAHAQALNDILLAAIAAIDVDSVELYPYGQPAILTTLRGNLMFNAYKVAETYNLPWDGPTFPTVHPGAGEG